MNHEAKVKPAYKVETVEEFLARGKKIQKIDFTNAYRKHQGFYLGRANYETNKEGHPTRLAQHKKRLEDVQVIKRKISENDI